MPFSSVKFLPDYASRKAGSIRALHKVGVDGMHLYRRDFDGEKIMTVQSAYVSLIDVNGAHMSRLVEVMLDWAENTIETDNNLLDELAASHDVENSYWECKWQEMFPVTEEQEMLIGLKMEGVKIKEDVYEWYLTYDVPYASVCPCSAEMCGIYGGIPHMQRALAKVTGRLNGHDSLADLASLTVERVQNAVGLVPIPLLKRPDELEWCKRAGQKHLFVEDAAREIANAIDSMYDDYVIVCEHYESIHQHNVVAVCRKGQKLL